MLFKTPLTFAVANGIVAERACCRSPSARRIPCAVCAIVGLFLMARSTACSSVTASIGGGVCAYAGATRRMSAAMIATVGLTAFAKVTAVKKADTTEAGE